MPDSLFDNFAGEKASHLSVVEEVHEAPIMPGRGDEPRQEARAQATLFAVAALCAAGAFAVVGLTTVVIAVAVPEHWLVALAFTGLFVLVAVGAGLGAVWRVRGRPPVRLQELGARSRSAARVIRRPAKGGRKRPSSR